MIHEMALAPVHVENESRGTFQPNPILVPGLNASFKSQNDHGNLAAFHHTRQSGATEPLAAHHFPGWSRS